MTKPMPEGSAIVRVALTQAELECAVDEYGLAEILAALSRVCDDKADHLRSNWQDGLSADLWASCAVELNAVASMAIVEDVS